MDEYTADLGALVLACLEHGRVISRDGAVLATFDQMLAELDDCYEIFREKIDEVHSAGDNRNPAP
jgi:hypothetical protein